MRLSRWRHVVARCWDFLAKLRRAWRVLCPLRPWGLGGNATLRVVPAAKASLLWRGLRVRIALHGAVRRGPATHFRGVSGLPLAAGAPWC